MGHLSWSLILKFITIKVTIPNRSCQQNQDLVATTLQVPPETIDHPHNKAPGRHLGARRSYTSKRDCYFSESKILIEYNDFLWKKHIYKIDGNKLKSGIAA